MKRNPAGVLLGHLLRHHPLRGQHVARSRGRLAQRARPESATPERWAIPLAEAAQPVRLHLGDAGEGLIAAALELSETVLGHQKRRQPGLDSDARRIQPAQDVVDLIERHLGRARAGRRLSRAHPALTQAREPPPLLLDAARPLRHDLGPSAEFPSGRVPARGDLLDRGKRRVRVEARAGLIEPDAKLVGQAGQAVDDRLDLPVRRDGRVLVLEEAADLGRPRGDLGERDRSAALRGWRRGLRVSDAGQDQHQPEGPAESSPDGAHGARG